MEVDEKKLHAIARNGNRRVRSTGDYTPVVIGHTSDDAPEDKQPEIVGYAHNFSVKPLLKTGRKAIHCTVKFFKNKMEKVKKYPRRSVELWLNKLEIDPI